MVVPMGPGCPGHPARLVDLASLENQTVPEYLVDPACLVHLVCLEIPVSPGHPVVLVYPEYPVGQMVQMGPEGPAFPECPVVRMVPKVQLGHVVQLVQMLQVKFLFVQQLGFGKRLNPEQQILFLPRWGLLTLVS